MVRNSRRARASFDLIASIELPHCCAKSANVLSSKYFRRQQRRIFGRQPRQHTADNFGNFALLASANQFSAHR